MTKTNLENQDMLIADASCDDSRLYVMTSSGKKITIPFEQIKSLKDSSYKVRSNFRVSEEGSYIHWPDNDLHMDLDGLMVLIDQSYRDRAKLESLRYNTVFGAGVASIRKECCVTQSEIDGVSEKEIRRIEKGEIFPNSSTIKKMAKAHSLNFDEYLNKIANLCESIVQTNKSAKKVMKKYGKTLKKLAE